MPVKINGTTSGSVTLAAPASGSDVTLTLPGSAGTAALTTDTGLAFITSSTFSAASSVSLNNCFTSTYDNYMLLFRATSSTNFEANLRMRVGGVDDTGANYQVEYLNISAGVSTSYRLTAQTSALLSQLNTGHNAFRADIFSPAIATPTIYVADGVRNGNTTTVEKIIASGGHGLSTAYDGCTLICTSGNFTGTIRVYGYRNS